ncbi:MAG: T9SS type A sorting domain-containing protein [Prevotella sp.]|nr:T9SS type A sorting domain-containing protein [Prevotella sp.]MBQ4294578.1 T9SS type A sorting domain-containing protein [Prevotella sp.]MBR7053297.1 T9SS type A sorting domain-containing protein [Prevotella sp.]
MSNKILAIIFSACLMMGVPAVANATNAIEIIDTETQNITLSVNETTLHIAGANGQVLQVYNVAGVRVMSVKVEGMDKRIELNLPKGCYIVKVGKVVRKIYIK